MKIFDWFNSTFWSIKNEIENTRHNPHSFSDDNQNRINPASSLPMSGSVDIHGNPFGASSTISYDPFAESNRHHTQFNDYHHTHHTDSFHNVSPHYDYHDPFRNY